MIVNSLTRAHGRRHTDRCPDSHERSPADPGRGRAHSDPIAVVTAAATVMFLVTKFTAGAWVVVLAIPAFITLFASIHRYHQRAGQLFGLGAIPGKPQVEPAIVVVPVAGISRLAERAISEAPSISAHVIAVTVVTGDADPDTGPDRELQEQWNRWNPGPAHAVEDQEDECGAQRIGPALWPGTVRTRHLRNVDGSGLPQWLDEARRRR